MIPLNVVFSANSADGFDRGLTTPVFVFFFLSFCNTKILNIVTSIFLLRHRILRGSSFSRGLCFRGSLCFRGLHFLGGLRF